MDNEKKNSNPQKINEKIDNLPSNQSNSNRRHNYNTKYPGELNSIGSNSEFSREGRKEKNPRVDRPEGAPLGINRLKEAPNRGREALKNLYKKDNEDKSKVEKPEDNKSSNPLENVKEKMRNPFRNMMPSNQEKEPEKDDESQTEPSEEDSTDKSGSEMLSDGFKKITNKASSFAKSKLGSSEEANGPVSILLKGKMSIIAKIIPIIIIVIAFFALMIVIAVTSSVTGKASSVSDVYDTDYYFGEEYDGDFDKIENKELKQMLKDMEDLKKDFTKDGKPFDHIMVMSTVSALLNNDSKNKLTYKSFTKSDLKEIAEVVSGKSDDEIKAGLDEYIIPKYLKDVKIPKDSEDDTVVEQPASPGTATTSKGYKIENRNGLYYINNILVVNKTYDVPSTYNPGGLTTEFYNAFSTMQSVASSQGINLKVASGYRSYSRQQELYNNYVSNNGKEQADTFSARPGHSEHQTGLAADINLVDDSFAKTDEFKWLNANMHKYGFILRYPSGKQQITGYKYESWHIRYVGTELSNQLYNNGNWITLEEYLGITSSYDSKPEVSSSVKAIKKKYSEVAEEAIEIRDTYYDFLGKTNSCITGGSCNYSISGFRSSNKSSAKSISVNNLKVRLMQSSKTGGKVGEPLPNSELIDFEKYVLGVAYAEIDCSENENYFKTQLVAARSFALSRPDAMGNSQGLKLEEENGQWILQIRSSTDDQQYCDPDLGCSYDPCGDNIEKCQIWAGTSHKKVYKGPLTQNSKCRQWASDTIGEVLVDSNGYIINTGYKQKDQNVFKSSTNYKSTLMSHYGSANSVDKADCNSGGDSQCAYGVSTGDYANWTQKCPECSNVPLGRSSTNIYRAGCAATSVAMLIAKSGADTSQIVNEYGAFNNVTFVKAMNKVGGFNSGGGIYWNATGRVVPNFLFVSDSTRGGLSGSREHKVEVLQGLINKGLYVVLQVKCKGNGEHYVALDSIQGDHVYIMDPATNETETWTANSRWKASCANRYITYRKA